MNFRNGWIRLCAIFILFQLTTGDNDHEKVMSMQKRVENLIEKVLQMVQDFYVRIKSDEKCIPDRIPDRIMETLKSSVDCIEANERDHRRSHLAAKRIHHRNFLRCFVEAKKKVRTILAKVDLLANHCPENVTEKTYEINVTTSYTKRFRIDIKNGLQVTKRVVEFAEPDRPLYLDGLPVEEKKKKMDDDDEEEEDEEEDEESVYNGTRTKIRPPYIPMYEDGELENSDDHYYDESESHYEENRKKLRTGNSYERITEGGNVEAEGGGTRMSALSHTISSVFFDNSD